MSTRNSIALTNDLTKTMTGQIKFDRGEHHKKGKKRF